MIELLPKKLFAVFFFVSLGLVIPVRSVYAHNTFPSYTQDGFWFLDDDASTGTAEDETGWGVPLVNEVGENTNISPVTKTTTFNLRMDVSETANQDQSLNLVWTLEYKLASGASCSDASGWTQVTTSSANDFQIVAGNVTNGTTTASDRISTSTSNFGSGNGALLDTQNTYSALLDNKSGETQWTLQATTNAADSTAYIFRVSNGGTALNSYTRCPQATTGAAPSPVYTQNDFEWFVDTTSVTLTNAWPAGTGTDIVENGQITQLPYSNDALTNTDKIRLQMNFTITSANLSATTEDFQLEYVAATDCTTATGWADVGAIAGGTIWRFFDNTSITDGVTQVNDISTTTSTAEGDYVESNPTQTNPNQIDVSENSEWDFAIENNGAADNTTYCFRMVIEDGGSGTAFDNYNADSYPKLTTAPVTSNQMRHGNIFSDEGEQGYYWTD